MVAVRKTLEALQLKRHNFKTSRQRRVPEEYAGRGKGKNRVMDVIYKKVLDASCKALNNLTVAYTKQLNAAINLYLRMKKPKIEGIFYSIYVLGAIFLAGKRPMMVHDEARVSW